MNRKAIALMVMVGLMVLVLPGHALAASPNQEITGNVYASLAITSPADNLDIHFIVGPNENTDSGLDNKVTCWSNVAYTVKINCDSPSGFKTTANMWQWVSSAYVETGNKLTAPMEIRERSTPGTYTAITGTAEAINGFSGKPKTTDAGVDAYIDYKQPVGYGDVILGSGTYRHLLTYTIVAST